MIEKEQEKLQRKLTGLEIENELLRIRLEEAEDALRAIRSGEVDALVVYSDDGEKIYSLEGSDFTYRVMVEKINEGAATLDPEGIVLYSNTRLAEMVGEPLNNLLGSSLLPYIHPADQAAFTALLKKGMDGPCRGEVTLSRRDGSLLPVILSFSSVGIKGVKTLCLLVTDLTEQKRNEAIQASERMARSILEQAAEAIVVCDEEGSVVRCSQGAFMLTNRNPLFRPFDESFPLISAGSADQGASFSIKEVLRGSSFQGVEALVSEVNGENGSNVGPAWVLASATPLRGERGHIFGAIVSMTDITERKKALQALRDSEELYRSIARNIPNGGVIIFDDLLSIRVAEGELIAQLGQSRTDLEGIAIPVLAKKGRLFITESECKSALAGESNSCECRVFDRDVWIQYAPLIREDGQVLAGMALALDITERKAAEQAYLKSQHLARENRSQIEIQRQLIEQREKERQQIARDLHDGPVQELMADIFFLHRILQETEGQVRKDLAAIYHSLQEQVSELRAYSSELRPPLLIQFGLEKAIQSHIGNFLGKYPHLNIHFSFDPTGKSIPENVLLTLYRIYQEGMNNIVKHSQARNVNIQYERSENKAVLEISDDGIGFTLPSDWTEPVRHGHLGLAGMRERAETAGGVLDVTTQPGQGTRLKITINME